ncbi:MAG: sigma-70 family RNA polymerase sigma factor [Planctomycetota bacterium]
MTKAQSREVTRLLAELSAGNCAVFDKLVPLVYDELRALADRALRTERREHTLQATALAHEAYLKLVDQRAVRWQHRAHFFAVAAQIMRRILVDHARARRACKRGGGRARVALDEIAVCPGEQVVELEALDQALQRLAKLDQRQSRIVEVRFFGGLTNEETAEVLGVSLATVKREWTVAKAWLRREIGEQRVDG